MRLAPLLILLLAGCIPPSQSCCCCPQKLTVQCESTVKPPDNARRDKVEKLQGDVGKAKEQVKTMREGLAQ
jgi:hypothetical protein